MIVRNEAKVIERCLRSVIPLIHSWVIVDTGSSDGTQALIRRLLKDVPGYLYEKPWRDFSTNRNEAIALAQGQGEYLLVVDADDVLEANGDFQWPSLDQDAYQIQVEHSGITHWRTHLFKPQGFYYDGILHEALVGPAHFRSARLEGIIYRRVGGGARSQNKEKYHDDAALLEKVLLQEPYNHRYAFYLAQSWRDAGELELAMRAYERRANMGGWAEEVYISLHEIGKLKSRLNLDPTQAYLKAFEFRPERAESICAIAAFFRNKNRHEAAYPFAQRAVTIARPDDVLFVDESVYQWRALDELAIAAYWTKRFDESETLNRRLLEVGPRSEQARLRRNLDMCVARKR